MTLLNIIESPNAEVYLLIVKLRKNLDLNVSKSYSMSEYPNIA
ncbi:hypothetical protein NIES4102_21820 [Chondrocystis sp. NIES-4102]|nr:hypothetical protein NIES4102_21820 [Chondrocystis sp. NIES-4102]